MVSDISRKLVRVSYLLVVCLALVAVAPLSAAPAKSKDASTKQSSAPVLKADAASTPAVDPAAVPVVCVKPADPDAAPTAENDEKASSTSRTSAADPETTADSPSESNSGFMKDKLKLSLGGKSGAASDQPQQCVVDEAKEK
jgi:hypothetical protein